MALAHAVGAQRGAGLQGLQLARAVHHVHRQARGRAHAHALTAAGLYLQEQLAQLAAARRQPRHVYMYKDAMRFFLPNNDYKVASYPSLVPDWDHSPRCGGRGVILHGSTPELFRVHARQVIDSVRQLPDEQRIVLVKSWNEWAEGNVLEDRFDQRWSAGETLRDLLGPRS